MIARKKLDDMYANDLGVPQSLEEAIACYKALHAAKKAAEQGDERAKKRLAELNDKKTPKDLPTDLQELYELFAAYNEGKGVKRSQKKLAKHAKYLMLAAEGGNDEAIAFGLPLVDPCDPQSKEEVEEWYRLAAERGRAEAQYYLGIFYARGFGVPQSYTKAVDYFTLAAEGGSTEAQLILGSMYRIGYLVGQSDEEAAKWYSLAAEQGDERAKERLAELRGK
jgi:TPR repeat protein